MEQLRKVVAVGCLTYVLYGLISWFQLGVFLPPLPVKPFIFLGFILFGLVNAIQSGFNKLDGSFYLWIVLVAVINQSFLELFLSTPELINFQDSIEVFFELLAVFLFILFNTLIIISLRRINYNFTLYFLILTILVIMIFALPSYIDLQKSTVIMGFIYFMTQRFSRKTIDASVQRTIVILTGVAIIEVIEMIALHQ
ncbi:MAG: hypothetical protein WEA99_05370 [Brumimicrobium sp.]